MKKLNLIALFIGLSIALVTASSFRTTDTLHGFNGSSWVSISGLVEEDDPNDVGPGEYACALNPESNCTALMESPSDTSPEQIEKGDLILYQGAE